MVTNTFSRMIGCSAFGVLLLLSGACGTADRTISKATQKAPSTFMTSHDTPIIIQGGSLWVWTQSAFSSYSRQSLTINTGTPLVNVYTSNDSIFSSPSGPMTLPASTTPWLICSGPPQYVQVQADSTGANVTANSYGPGAGSSLPIFWDTEFGNGVTKSFFKSGRLHMEGAPFGGLFFGPGGSGANCTSIVTTAAPGNGTSPTLCSGALSAACQIAAPNTAIFIAISKN